MNNVKGDENSMAYEIVKIQASESKWKNILIALLIVTLAFCNMAWLYVFQQYDYESSDILIEAADGGAAHYIENGDVNYGEDSSEKETQN